MLTNPIKSNRFQFKSYFFDMATPFSWIMPIHTLISLTHQKLICPFYHTISDNYLKHIAHLYTPLNINRFIHDLDFLLKHFEPISVQQVYTHLINNTSPKKPSFLLSFDDGLSEVYSVVYPLLKKKGVPAVVFVNTSFIDNKDLFYRYKISLVNEAIQQQPALNRLIFTILQDNEIQGEDVFAKLLNITYNQRNLVDKILPVCDVDVKEYLQSQQPYLTSSQLMELSKNDFVIGAHGVDHSEFQSLSFDDRVFQIQQSVNEVKERFSPPLKLFAYPFTDFGLSSDWFNFVNKNNLVDLSFGGAGIYKDMAKNHLQRIPMEKRYAKTAKEMIAKEYLYFLTKKIMGREQLKR